MLSGDRVLVSVAKIKEETNYWFVRTQQGEYYEDFFLNNFIGINWDDVSHTDVLNEEQPVVVEKIKQVYPDEVHPGHVYNQLRRFVAEMKEGDIVLIPSKRSTHISFGIVQSGLVIEKVSDDAIFEGACPFEKRRRVSWLKTVARHKLDPYLFMLFYSQHTITNANEYSIYIDRTLHSLYLKGENAHLILRVTTDEQIYARDFLKVLDGALDLVDYFSEFSESNINTNDFEIKVNVQSPGPVEIIAGVLGIGVLALVLHYIIGGKFAGKFSWKEFSFDGETDGLIEKFLKFKEKAKDDQKITAKVIEIKEAMEKLKIEVPGEIGANEDLNLIEEKPKPAE